MCQFSAAEQTNAAKLFFFFFFFFCKGFKKTVPNQRLNETKATLRNAFVDNIFALESQKESKNNKKSSF